MPRKRKSFLSLGKPCQRTKRRRTTEKITCQANWNTEINLIPEEDVRVRSNEEHPNDTTSHRLNHLQNDEKATYIDDINWNLDMQIIFSKLKAVGKDYTFRTLLNLIKNDIFPMQNICFNLFFEYIEWLSSTSTTAMRYSKGTKEFWWTGKSLFGSKFLRFMEGFKHKGTVTRGETQKGFYDPLKTSVNFAVPSESVIMEYSPFNTIDGYRSNISPGLIKPIVDVYASNARDESHVMSFDGKKIIPNTADVDLLGCEDKGTLAVQQTLTSDKDFICKIEHMVDDLQTMNVEQLTEVPTQNHEILAEQLKDVHCHFSRRYQTVRELAQAKSYALSKLRDKGLSKDQYLINHLQTCLYQCSNTTKDVMETLEQLCCSVSILNGAGHLFKKGTHVDLQLQENFTELLTPEETMIALRLHGCALPTQITKQRTQQWFDVRKEVKVTGSSIHKAIGATSLKQQKEFFDELFSGKKKEYSEFEKAAMSFGTENEINEIATLVAKIMPVFYPDLIYNEEGMYMIKDDENRKVIAVSPDGSLRAVKNGHTDFNQQPVVSIEIKCPYSSVTAGIPVYQTVQRHYLSQCFLEQKVLNSKEHILLCWTPESTTVLRVPSCDTIVSKSIEEVKKIYYADYPKRPTKRSESVKEIAKSLVEHVKKCELIGEFPSINSVEQLRQKRIVNGLPYRKGKKDVSQEILTLEIQDLCKTLLKTKELMNNMIDLYKKKASEVILFSLPDSDRIWKRELGHGMPIGYFFRGYSLNAPCMRDIALQMLTSCTKEALHVPCTCYDGQWYKLKDEGHDGSPLTIFQLKRNHWKYVSSLNKQELMIKLCEVRSKVDYTRGPTQASEKSIEHVLYLESGDPPLVMPVTLPKRSSKNSSTNETRISASLTESLVEDNLSSESVEIENDDVFDDEILLQNDNIQLDLQQSSSSLDNDGDERLGVLQISTDDLDAIRLILQGSKRLKTTLSSNLDVTDLLSDVNKLKKLTDNDLKEIMNYLNIKIRGMGKEMSVKGSKGKKLNELCLHLGIEVSDELLEKQNTRPLKSQKHCAL